MGKLNLETVKKKFDENGCVLLESDYINNTTKMKFICSCGNKGLKSWSNFRVSPRCSDCSKKNSLKNLSDSLSERKLKYDYVKEYIESKGCSLLSKSYKSNNSKLDIRCSCGNIYVVSFAKFKDRRQTVCKECSTQAIRENLSFSYEFVKNFIEVESKSECKLITKSYTNNTQKIDVLCKCGNKFQTTFADFKSDDTKLRHCKECSKLIRRKIFGHTYDYVKEFIEAVNDNKLISKTYTRAKDYNLEIQCKCGERYITSFDVFQRDVGGKNRCDKCSNSQSSNELAIEKYLIDKGFKFKMEYTIDDCKDKDMLRFDFAILDEQDDILKLIEADGEGHYKPVRFGGISDKQAIENFESQKRRDLIKDNYCKDNKIELIRIPYFEIDNLEKFI